MLRTVYLQTASSFMNEWQTKNGRQQCSLSSSNCHKS